ncbi:ParB-like nuclease domain protein [Gimesia maris]|uniref:ParB N-terminal domain-containing protein n=1 Tax=Gimesia maris TaxID=122 RepID=UPI0011884605|nr:ParB N-terminal domain-containing protein [Gimesia maris]QDU16902.1 ParB-like nuclease domain protein [Gimesia maris]
MNYVLNHVCLGKLTRHPLSITLYGYELEPSFIASVRQHGIICPIQVTQDLIIVDGHKRFQAAREVGIVEDHVIVRMDLDDEWSIQEALIECNRHRDRSAEVKHHESQVLAAIKQERLREREIIQGRQEAVAVGQTEYEPFKFSPYQWEYDP